MLEDVFPAAEKILSDIENVLKKDSNLISFEIIPAEDNENKSPVFHDEHSLGLASWCVQPLYCYAYNRLLNLRHNKHKREEPTIVSRWLMGALLLNPDVSTFWNMRRELVKNDRLDSMQEFRFVNLVLYYKPKCFEAFAYRRWLIKLLLSPGRCGYTVNVPALLGGEIRAAGIAAERYANNCHAWSHRQHVITTFEENASSQFYNTLLKEWEETAKWCDRHISDYSGFAYRQFLLKRLLLFDKEHEITADFLARKREIILNFMLISEKDWRDGCSFRDISCKEILSALHGTEETVDHSKDEVHERLLVNLSYWAEECLLNKDLINAYPGHEALWTHRRFLAYALKALCTSYKSFFSYKTEIFDPRKSIRPCLDDEGRCLTRLEIAFQDHNRDVVNSAKTLGQHQLSLAEKFVKFLAIVNLEL